MLSIIKGPHADFIVNARPSLLAQIELLVPGALVYGMPPGTSRYTPGWGRRRVRWDAASSFTEGWRGGGPEPQVSRILVVADGAYFVSVCLQQMGVAFRVEHFDPPVYVSRKEEIKRLEMIDKGRAALREVEAAGWLKPKWSDRAYNVQAEVCGWVAEGLQSPLIIWPGGSGKTIAAHMIMQMMGARHNGALVMIVPGNTRLGWASDLRKVSQLEGYVCLAKAAGGGGRDLFRYLDRCDNRGQPPLIVVGREWLSAWYNALKELDIVALGIDEIDETAPDPKTYRNCTIQEDGSVQMAYQRTDRKGLVKRGACIAELALDLKVKMRLGLTATPLGEGTPTALWRTLNLMRAGAFGYGDFNYKMRYCGQARDENGYWKTFKATNTTELAQRCMVYMHRTTYAETHGDLPPVSYQLVKIGKEDWDKRAESNRFNAQYTWNQAMRARAKLDNATKGETVHGDSDDLMTLEGTNAGEIGLMHACAVKRPAVCQMALETCVAGGRAIIGVGRRHEAILFQEHFDRTAKKKSLEGTTPPPSFVATGAQSLEERARIVEEWRKTNGVLIITYAAMGRGVDGMQHCDLIIAAQVMAGPKGGARLEQFFKRADRRGRERNLRCVIAIAEGTADTQKLQELAAAYTFFADFMGEALFDDIAEVMHDRMSKSDAVSELLDGLW